MKYIKPKKEYESNYLFNLLRDRNILDIERFLNPKEDCLLDPAGLCNMNAGYLMMKQHLNDKIFLVVDADQDGYTSAAIFYLYFKRVNPDLDITYFLHDGKQHGLEDCYKTILEGDYDLVVIPDASSNDYEFHKILKESGLDILILDHHEAPQISTDACVINNQLSEDYANKSLSGAGVVYKYCQYWDTMVGTDYADDYLDLAAIGIIGDMMDVRGLENRYIFKKGLANITNPCMKAIVEKQAFSIGDTNHITPISISFYVTPLVNALIRVGTPEQKDLLFRALVDGDKIIPSTKRGAREGATETIAEQNARNCVNAKSRQNRMKEKALDSLEMQICKEGLDENKIIITEVEDNSIDTVLTGLVAMQLVAKYKKPALVLRLDSEGNLKGSGRGESKSGLKDFKGFLNESGYFDFAEGHANAFGASIKKDKVLDFTKYANEALKDVDFNEGVYEPEFLFDVDNAQLMDAILSVGSHPEIWGQGNDEPMFVTTNIHLTSDDINIIGKNNDTLRFEVGGITFIKFKAKDMIRELKDKTDFTLEIVGRANINEWGGVQSPQIFIEDYNFHNNALDF